MVSHRVEGRPRCAGASSRSLCWVNPALRRSRGPSVSFVALRGTHAAGHQLTMAKGISLAARFVKAAPEQSLADHKDAAPQMWAPAGRRHSGRMRRDARLETVLGHNRESLACKPSLGKPLRTCWSRVMPHVPVLQVAPRHTRHRSLKAAACALPAAGRQRPSASGRTFVAPARPQCRRGARLRRRMRCPCQRSQVRHWSR